MELINTDGIALIGPGSEWFWTALGFAALASTFYAIYRQLKAQHLQIEENTRVHLSEGYYNAIRLGQQPLEMLIQDESLARIASLGYDTPEALTDVEWARFGNFMFLQFNAWEFFYYQHGGSQIPKQLWVGADAYYRDLIATRPGLARFWAEFEGVYDEPFRSYVAQDFAKEPMGPTAAV